jgi:NhaP-type Na+/H+ and K+/H+ antiporter
VPVQSCSRDPRGVGKRSLHQFRSTHRLILALRVGAVLISVALLAVAAQLMAALSWQSDFLLAAVAALAWAYVFERGNE